jgi:hypothetical protein
MAYVKVCVTIKFPDKETAEASKGDARKAVFSAIKEELGWDCDVVARAFD